MKRKVLLILGLVLAMAMVVLFALPVMADPAVTLSISGPTGTKVATSTYTATLTTKKAESGSIELYNSGKKSYDTALGTFSWATISVVDQSADSSVEYTFTYTPLTTSGSQTIEAKYTRGVLVMLLIIKITLS